MLSLSPITLESMETLRPYLEKGRFRLCDYAPGAIFQWRAYMHSKYALAADMLIMTLQEEDGTSGYMFPVGGGNLNDALSAIEADAKERGIPLLYCAVPEEGLTVLRARYGSRAKAEALRQWADYLYNKDDLITFPGKKYHTQRNHYNRFKKEFPNHCFVPVTAETLPTAQRFLDEYQQYASIKKPIEAEEMKRARELLCDTLQLDQMAGYIQVDGITIALAIGETLHDTLYVHVEKARTDYAGAYQAIVSQFAAYAAGPDIQYINREDDSGEEGLRYSKLEYRPIKLLEKYWVCVED